MDSPDSCLQAVFMMHSEIVLGGVFVVPPAKAEEMYHPETFGRGKTDQVRVE